jgi:glutaminyl-tRNA synthetase
LPEAELNPNSLEVLTECKLEPALRKVVPFERYQVERLFNRTVALRDTRAKVEKRSGR